MSESGDYDPGPWSGYDFNSARRAYDDVIDRSYADAVVAKKDRSDCVPNEVISESEAPLIIVTDVTGSMGEWPATIFSKLPYLDLEGKEYLGKELEICFAAVGDMFSDSYPLQVQNFAKSTDLKTKLESLIIEKGGGGTKQESYDLAALYFLKNCKTPNAIRKPILIFIGDEGFYNFVDPAGGAEWARADMSERLSLETLFEQLCEKFSVYCVLKPYGSSSATAINELNDTNKGIAEQWESLLGADRIAVLPEAGRVVDVIFGILAKDTDRIEYFEDELKGRQKKEQVNLVLKSLNTMHTLPKIEHKKSMKKLPAPGKSVTRHGGNNDNSPKSKSLLG